MRSKISIFILLVVSIIFFVFGLYFPILATKEQVFGIVLNYQEIRLFDSVRMFYENNEYLLATVIFLFTIVLPTIKFFDIFIRIFSTFNSQKRSNFWHLLDKWSMLDVFLVALLLLNFKMDSNIIVMKLKIGTTFLAISIITRMIATMLWDLNNRASRNNWGSNKGI